VPLTPQQLADFQRLRQSYAPVLEAQRRKQQAQANLEKMHGLPPVKPQPKADGGLAKFLTGTKVKERVYRGTSRVENPNQIGNWFTSNPYNASEFAKNKSTEDFEPGAIVGAYHMALKNPLIIDAKGLDYNNLPAQKINKKHPHLKIPQNLDEITTDEIVALAKKSNKHDGVIFKNVNESDAVVDAEPATTYVSFRPNQIKSAIGNRGTYDPSNPDINMAKGGAVEPKKTVKAYKLFRVHPDHPGKLFPLFVDANTPVEMNKWVDAKEGEMANGKVKSKIGALAYRPGWHAGDLPIATHIGEKSDPKLTAPDRRPANHAWAEVEMPDDVDWQSEATKRGTNAQGKVIPVKSHITDQIPKGGHYRYKTNPNMTGNWLIGGSMKVNKVLTDAEVKSINKAAGMADLPRAQPFKKKTFGFAGGGCVGPQEWMAEEHVNHKAKGGKAKFLENSKVKDVLYRGGIGHKELSSDFLEGKPRAGYATFASTSPHVAGSYAHTDEDESEHAGGIAPMHIKAHTLHEFPVTVDKHGSRNFDKFAFDRFARRLEPGHAVVARQVIDYGPRASTKTDPERRYSYPSDIYAWNKGTETKSALAKAKGGSIEANKQMIEDVYGKYPVHPFNPNQRAMIEGEGENQTLGTFELKPSMSARNAVELDWLSAYPHKQGVGSRTLKALQGHATEHGVGMTLFPWEHGGVSQSKLMKFYKKHGFVPTTKGGKAMIWRPKDKAKGGRVTHAHHLEIEERPL